MLNHRECIERRIGMSKEEEDHREYIETIICMSKEEEDEMGSSVVKTPRQARWLLIWECILSALNFSVFKLSPFFHPRTNQPLCIFYNFIIFQAVLLCIHYAFIRNPFLIVTPFVIFPFIISLVIFLSPDLPFPPLVSSPFHQQTVSVYVSYAVFLSVSCALGSLSFLSLFGPRRVFIGFVMGFFYALQYMYQKRWILCFPATQRHPSIRFIMGIPVAAFRALQLSVVTYVFSAVPALFIADEFKVPTTTEQFIFQQITFFTGIFFVLVCWELNHHFHQVLHTTRVVFASPEDSATAETNPSEALLAALEESTPRSLRRYLAYLDLCMVCESNGETGDTWRRVAFFEETGETHHRVMTACLEPLEKLTLELAEGFENKNSAEKSVQIDNQSTHLQSESRTCGVFFDFQLCAWCARIAASLTVHSLKEDHFKVARNCGSYAAAMSAFLSCLLAIEAFMEKKTNLQSPQLTDPADIKWPTTLIVKSNPLYSKACSMTDILSTSIRSIVTAFHNEMASSDRFVYEVWVINKPLFGTRDALLQKLCLFLENREN